jgi:hypothetical protein
MAKSKRPIAKMNEESALDIAIGETEYGEASWPKDYPMPPVQARTYWYVDFTINNCEPSRLKWALEHLFMVCLGICQDGTDDLLRQVKRWLINPLDYNDCEGFHFSVEIPPSAIIRMWMQSSQSRDNGKCMTIIDDSADISATMKVRQELGSELTLRIT